MPRPLTVAALQTHHGWDVEENICRVLAMAAEAADRGAELILPSELFETPYFCKSTSP
ncbi:MAG: nitrilase-related carbon-nitrogen hydrolase, partial [Pseudomonadota bacterium]